MTLRTCNIQVCNSLTDRRTNPFRKVVGLEIVPDLGTRIDLRNIQILGLLRQGSLSNDDLLMGQLTFLLKNLNTSIFMKY